MRIKRPTKKNRTGDQVGKRAKNLKRTSHINSNLSEQVRIQICRQKFQNVAKLKKWMILTFLWHLLRIHDHKIWCFMCRVCSQWVDFWRRWKFENKTKWLYSSDTNGTTCQVKHHCDSSPISKTKFWLWNSTSCINCSTYSTRYSGISGVSLIFSVTLLFHYVASVPQTSISWTVYHSDDNAYLISRLIISLHIESHFLPDASWIQTERGHHE